MTKLNYKERKELVRKDLREFPMRIVFYLSRNNEGKYGIEFTRSKKTKKIENYKLEELQKTTIDSSISTPLEVIDINDFDELEEKLEKISKRWIKEKI